MSTNKKIKHPLEEQNISHELSDEDIENVVGGVSVSAAALSNRVGRVGATTVLKCPACGVGEENFTVLNVAELKYKCPCGAVLQYNSTKKCFLQI